MKYQRILCDILLENKKIIKKTKRFSFRELYYTLLLFFSSNPRLILVFDGMK